MTAKYNADSSQIEARSTWVDEQEIQHCEGPNKEAAVDLGYEDEVQEQARLNHQQRIKAKWIKKGLSTPDEFRGSYSATGSNA